MSFSEKQKQVLNEPVPAELIRERKLYGDRGKVLHYIEAHEAIRMANEIFGHDGWSSEVIDIALEHMDKSDGKWVVIYRCTVRVYAGGVHHDGVATGAGQQGSLADAMDKAAKTAESDAIKRALVKFGERFGLSLYRDEEPRQSAHRQPVQQAQAQHATQQPDPSLNAARRDPSGYSQWLTNALMACQTIQDLKAIWKENEAGAFHLKANFPELYRPVKEALNTRHAQLNPAGVP